MTYNDHVSKKRLFGCILFQALASPHPLIKGFPNQAILRNCYRLKTQENGSVPSDPIATDDIIFDMQNSAYSHNFGRDGMLQFGLPGYDS